MMRRRLRIGSMIALLAAVGACEGGEIVIFAPAQAGSAGHDASAGMSGTTLAGAGGSPAELAGNGGSAPSGWGGEGAALGDPCQSSDDCDLSWYCQKQNCADTAGVCLPIPTDDPTFLPVCGCDGVTYWNDSLRQVARISASTPRECQSGAKPCRNGSDCGTFGACRQRLPSVNDCGTSPGKGQCWAIPNDCTSAGDRPVGLPCPPPPGTTPGPPPQCLTLCQALQADRPYVALPQGWDCGQ